MEASTTTRPASEAREDESITFAGESTVKGLAERIGSSVRATMAFGDPIERGDVTVIPVAKARYGVGGGDNRGRKRDAPGSGGGGGAIVSPAGYIEIHTDGSTRFRRIHSSAGIVILGGAAILGTLAAVWTLKPSQPRSPRHTSISRRRWKRHHAARFGR